MSMFWIIYCIAALIVVGIFVLLIRSDIKKGEAVKVTLQDVLLYACMTLIPYWNAVVAIIMMWYYVSQHGKEHSITFGKGKEPK